MSRMVPISVCRLTETISLHDGLRRLALWLGVEMHLQNAVIACDPQAATITLEDKTTLSGDVVIGADGIHVG